MEQVNLRLGFKLHPEQRQIYDDPTRFRVLDCGRKFGKTTMCIAEMARAVALGQRVAYCCPTNKMLGYMWRTVKALLEPITLDKSEQDHRIETINHAEVEFWSLDNPDGPRPFEYDLIIVDEAAMLQIMEIFSAVLRPCLMKRHGRALFCSTPIGFDGFWEMFDLGQHHELNPEWKSWQKPSWANPHLDPAEIEVNRRQMPINIFSREIEAKFIDASGAVFRKIDVAAKKGHMQASPFEGHAYVIGVDLAKSTDFSVFAVYDMTLRALCWMDHANQIDYSLQLQRLVDLAYRFKAVGIVIEQNANLAFVESFYKTGLPLIPFQTGGGTKALIVENLAAAFDREEIAILNDPDLLSELQAFGMERLPSGMLRYGSRGTQHDDRVMALALAYYGATYSVPTWEAEIVDFVPSADNWPASTTVDALFSAQKPDEMPGDRAVMWPTPEYLLAEMPIKQTTDFLVRSSNPAALDKLLMSNFKSSLVENAPGVYTQIDGCYVVRCRGNGDYVKHAIQQQGYAEFVRELEAML